MVVDLLSLLWHLLGELLLHLCHIHDGGHLWLDGHLVHDSPGWDSLPYTLVSHQDDFSSSLGRVSGCVSSWIPWLLLPDGGGHDVLLPGNVPLVGLHPGQPRLLLSGDILAPLQLGGIHDHYQLSPLLSSSHPLPPHP